MQFTIQLTIGGTESVQGFYARAENPTRAVPKEQAEGISTYNFRWIPKQVIENWNTAQTQHSPTQQQKILN